MDVFKKKVLYQTARSLVVVMENVDLSWYVCLRTECILVEMILNPNKSTNPNRHRVVGRRQTTVTHVPFNVSRVGITGPCAVCGCLVCTRVESL
jgi:hypothetical protein